MDYPAKITKIEAQKKNKSRVSVFLNEAFAFGLDAAIAAKYGLCEGEELAKEQVEQLLLKEERKRAKDQAFRYLAGRAHSEQELRIKLAHKGFAAKLIDEVVAELKAAKYVDDADFAMAYARSRLLQKPIGEKRLRHELWQKGVSEEIIERTVDAVYSERSESQLAREVVQKKQPQYRHLQPSQAKKRLGDFMLRRGFDWEVVKEVVEEAF